MTNPILNYVTFGDKNSPALVILHGFLGSSKNWSTIAKILVDRYYVITVDLRNHGESFHHDSHTYDDMVNDIKLMIESMGLSRVHLMGHSMGGKVAMKFACLHPTNLKSLIVVDIAPKQYYPHRQEVKSMLALDLPKLKNRLEAEELLMPDVPDLGLRKFLLTNLATDNNGKFFWRVNLPVFNRDVPALGCNPLIEGEKFSGPSLFILGGKSDFVKEFDYPLIYKYFSNAEIEVIETSDHNPHFSARENFLNILRNFLDQF